MNKRQLEILKILLSTATIGDKPPIASIPEATELLAHREDRSFGRGMIAGALITAFVVAVIGLGIFFSYRAATATPPTDYLPPAPGIVLDTLYQDSAWKDYPQPLPIPKVEEIYDRAIRSERPQHKSKP